MMAAVSTSETSAYFYQTTRRNIPEDGHLHTRRHEDLKSHLAYPDLGGHVTPPLCVCVCVEGSYIQATRDQFCSIFQNTTRLLVCQCLWISPNNLLFLRRLYLR
jgi:hypothetical protein